jgi:hypothetical protein
MIRIADAGSIESENTGDVLAVNHDNKSGFLLIEQTPAACAHDNRYP